MGKITTLKKNREKLTAIAEYFKGFDQVECPVKHRFAPGCYLREIFMPASTLVVGKIHATEHFNIIISGSATVITINKDGGFDREYVKAGDTFVSGAGIQKVVAIHEDCTWQTVHVTSKTDLKEIEADIIAPTYEELPIFGIEGLI